MVGRKISKRVKKKHLIARNDRANEYFRNYNKKTLSEKFIKKCNNVLVNNEQKCNCFYDSQKQYPKSNYKGCIKNYYVKQEIC